MAIVQIALDFDNLERAIKLAKEAVAGGADWLEAGTPLIKSEGLDAVRRLRAEFPDCTIVADMKTMDAGRAEVEMAAKAGANIAVVMGVASEATVRECIEAGRNYGIRVAVDLMGVENPAERAKDFATWGVDHIGMHVAIDEQMRGEQPFDKLRAIVQAVDIPVAVAGGINSETAVDAVEAGAEIVIVGGAISKAVDATVATREIKHAIETKTKVKTGLFKRVGEEDIREVLTRVSTANISDGAHRMPSLAGIWPVVTGAKAVGPAVTVRTCPGDWAKPVEAIDHAKPGDVIVVDAGGVEPALWGDLATHSCIQKNVAGVVINGAIRDTSVIRELGFPAFAKIVCSNAGEPKGLGEIGVPITISGVRISPGDWVVADDDGVMILPRERAVELTNRAMECLERENRMRKEIEEGKTTLGDVAELLKWEKK